MYSKILSLIRFIERLFTRLSISLQIERIRESDYNNVLRFLENNRPIQTDKSMVRLGSDEDGGYLLPNDFNGINYCLSPGVSDNASFELSLYENYGIKSYLCDYSVSKPPVQCSGFSFTKKFLNSYNSGNFMTLECWMNELIIDDEMILQMDIEGFEYEVLTHTNINYLKKFRIIIVEFHHFHSILNEYGFRMISSIFDKLGSEFVPVHIHPNPNYKSYSYRSLSIPPLLEYTFLRKDRVKSFRNAINFPHELDHNRSFPLPKCFYQDSQISAEL